MMESQKGPKNVTWKTRKARENQRKTGMKQLDVVVSPPAYVWNPYLTFIHATFDLDPCDL